MNVTEILELAPEMIARKAETIVRCQKEHDITLHNLEVAKAAATLKYHDSSKNQKILEAYIINDPDVLKREVAVIEAKTAMKLASIDWEEWENLFTSARKMASMNITAHEISWRGDSPIIPNPES